MKYKIGFKLNWLEMIIVILIAFFAGLLVNRSTENNFIYVSMLILAAGIIVIKKRVKMPLK